MKVLVIGGGGREHALGWKIALSPLLTKLYFSPGNPGTAEWGENVSLAGVEDIVSFATANGVDLVVVGPEAPLVVGLADRLETADIACFGPLAAAARLEGSKDFAKRVMTESGVPTANYRTFDDYEAALAHVRERPHPLVVKADGLAAGKGVTVCTRLEESEAALAEAMQQARFGEAGARVVVEDFLEGTEASFHLITDGKRFLPLITSKDHKPLLEGDQGPNTGGMGTYAPNPLITPELAERVRTQVCEPVLSWLRDQGITYRGVLYAGLMLTWHGPKVLEFNVRFGDPETQVIMPMLDFDLLPVLHGAARGQLPEGDFPFRKGAAVCVVLASAGYPAGSSKGDVISGVSNHDNGVVFHAGTATDGYRLVTNGGRVLGVTAWDDDLEQAGLEAYKMVENIKFDGMQYRRDIGGTHESS